MCECGDGSWERHVGNDRIVNDEIIEKMWYFMHCRDDSGTDSKMVKKGGSSRETKESRPGYHRVSHK